MRFYEAHELLDQASKELKNLVSANPLALKLQEVEAALKMLKAAGGPSRNEILQKRLELLLAGPG